MRDARFGPPAFRPGAEFPTPALYERGSIREPCDRRQERCFAGGFGFVAPKKTKFFGKAFGAAGDVFALNPAKPTPRVPVLQVGGLVGDRVTKRLSLLTGYIETMTNSRLRRTNLYLPTFVAVAATRIHGHVSFFAPCTVNEKSWGCSGQLAPMCGNRPHRQSDTLALSVRFFIVHWRHRRAEYKKRIVR